MDMQKKRAKRFLYLLAFIASGDFFYLFYFLILNIKFVKIFDKSIKIYRALYAIIILMFN